MAEGQKISTRRSKGFRKTATLVEDRLRHAGESRGFAVTRLITHWEDVVGPDTARVCQPVKVSYAQNGFGATLTILTTGAQAPMLTMQLDQIRNKVNACYGYNAISRIRITQTAPIGFSEKQQPFQHAPQKSQPTPHMQQTAETVTRDIKDPELRAVLRDFGVNVISQPKTE